MPRLFTGFALPASATEPLRNFRGGLPGARWIEPSDFHVTLRFFGDVSPQTADDLHEALQNARLRDRVTIALNGLAEFGGSRPRAIYAVVKPTAGLAELQREHERIARDLGMAPETRKFTPHVTLARLGRSVQAADVARHLTQMGALAPVEFVARHVTLFSARESRGGGPYIPEAEYPFVGSERISRSELPVPD